VNWIHLDRFIDHRIIPFLHDSSRAQLGVIGHFPMKVFVAPILLLGNAPHAESLITKKRRVRVVLSDDGVNRALEIAARLLTVSRLEGCPLVS
jgi:hypothetical protein